MKVENLLAVKSSRSTVTISPDAPLADAAKLLSENNVGLAVVVGAHGELLGVFSERYIVRAVAEAAAAATSTTVADLMTAKVVTCGPGDDVRDVIRTMGEGGIRHMPVVSDGRSVEVISKTDVLAYMIKELDPEERVAVLQTVLEGTAGVPWI